MRRHTLQAHRQCLFVQLQPLFTIGVRHLWPNRSEILSSNAVPGKSLRPALWIYPNLPLGDHPPRTLLWAAGTRHWLKSNFKGGPGAQICCQKALASTNADIAKKKTSGHLHDWGQLTSLRADDYSQWVG